MSRYAGPQRTCRRTGAAAALLALGISVQSAAPAAGAPLPVSVRLDVTLNLSRLHPAATTGAIECGAVAQTRSWVDANRSGLVDYASTQRLVLSQAHYFGQYARVTFPITGRGYSGTQTFTTSLSVQGQVDPSTHVQYQTPAILIACWLSINGQPAVWDRATGLQVLSSNNFTSVSANPLVTAVSDAGAPIALTGQLSVQGTVFAPAPVALSTNLQIQGPMSTARSASGNPAALQAAAPANRAALGVPVPQAMAVSPSVANAAASSTSSTPALSVTAPGAGTGTPKLGAPATATTPVGKTLSTNVPPVTGIWASSANAAAHTLFWPCVNEVGCNPDLPAGSPSYTYEVWIKDPAATGFTLLSSTAQLVDGCPDPNFGPCGPTTTIKLDMTRFLTPQTAFRVIRKDQATGLQSTGDFVYAAPAQPVQPAGFTAAEPQYGQVAMSWQAVPGAVDYLLYEKGVNAPPTRVSATNTALQSVPAGTHTYQVATEYSPGFRNTNMPEATVMVHTAPPGRSVPYLTRNNGAGNAALAQLHQAANGEGIGGALQNVAFHRGLLTGWDSNGYLTWISPLSLAWYGNATELGFARSVGCWQWPNRVGTITVGMVTFCLAGNHGSPPGTQLPDSASLAANTGGIADTYGLIVTSPTTGQFFANFAGGVGNPLQTSNIDDWARRWASVATTTLDSEGPKYTPNACLACHGGTVNQVTGKVTGASLLPIDPGLVVFPGNRAAEEESIRQINAMIVNSMPAAAISDYINGLYGGKVSVPGTTSQSNYVPASWSQQAQLFQAVVKSDCLMCHLATPAARSFGSAAGFMQNKAAIYADVCNAHSMPNAEVPYVRFWTSTGALGGTSVNLAGYMMAILGYNSCP